MGLTQSQKTILEKARALGGGDQGIALTEATCCYLIAIIAGDLGLTMSFPELGTETQAFFGTSPASSLVIPDVPLVPLFERLISLNPDADTYFACLAALHKGRLKYERILETQPIPTIEQVGPRSLLQYGRLTPSSLAGLLFWRKWFYDIDNRAAQETGYVFEPIIANAIGGAPANARLSPVKRKANPAKRRQVDCIREMRAYELKMRVTIAASGQGRWAEESTFPEDCRFSGYTPILIVLDATANPKLTVLRQAFLNENGECYAGAAAWEHLDGIAGPTMASFLERYIRTPLQSLLASDPIILPDFTARMSQNDITLTLGDESLMIDRSKEKAEPEEDAELPDDVTDALPGV
jgi:hypothetical protein